MSEEKDTYEIEEEPTPPASPVTPPAAADASDVKALDVCPNCGKSMRASDTLVCMACGFDLKSMRVVETAVGEEVDDGDDEDAEPLVRTRAVDRWAPLTLAGIAVGVISIGVLAGTRGLFPGSDDVELDMGRRLLGLIRYPVLIAITSACGIGALFAVARLMERPVGDLRTAALRMMGVSSLAWMAAFTNVKWPAGEFLLELPIAGALMAVGILVMFRLTPSRALTLVGVTVSLFFVVLAGAELVAWLL